MQLIWSLHDVTPATLATCREILRCLGTHAIRDVLILVIPSQMAWNTKEIAELRALEHDGYSIAAHGWTHRARALTTPYEIAHARLFSRDSAEHFGRAPSEILGSMEKSRKWFGEVGLQLPSVYVPPAWALGRLPRRLLRESSFDFVETLSGAYDTKSARFFHLPLVGFQAFKSWQAIFLRISNETNLLAGRAINRPVRVAVHPGDFGLLLGAKVAELIGRHFGTSTLAACFQ